MKAAILSATRVEFKRKRPGRPASGLTRAWVDVQTGWPADARMGGRKMLRFAQRGSSGGDNPGLAVSSLWVSVALAAGMALGLGALLIAELPPCFSIRGDGFIHQIMADNCREDGFCFADLAVLSKAGLAHGALWIRMLEAGNALGLDTMDLAVVWALLTALGLGLIGALVTRRNGVVSGVVLAVGWFGWALGLPELFSVDSFWNATAMPLSTCLYLGVAMVAASSSGLWPWALLGVLGGVASLFHLVFLLYFAVSIVTLLPDSSHRRLESILASALGLAGTLALCSPNLLMGQRLLPDQPLMWGLWLGGALLLCLMVALARSGRIAVAGRWLRRPIAWWWQLHPVLRLTGSLGAVGMGMLASGTYFYYWVPGVISATIWAAWYVGGLWLRHAGLRRVLAVGAAVLALLVVVESALMRRPSQDSTQTACLLTRSKLGPHFKQLASWFGGDFDLVRTRLHVPAGNTQDVWGHALWLWPAAVNAADSLGATERLEEGQSALLSADGSRLVKVPTVFDAQRSFSCVASDNLADCTCWPRWVQRCESASDPAATQWRWLCSFGPGEMDFVPGRHAFLVLPKHEAAARLTQSGDVPLVVPPLRLQGMEYDIAGEILEQSPSFSSATLGARSGSVGAAVGPADWVVAWYHAPDDAGIELGEAARLGLLPIPFPQSAELAGWDRSDPLGPENPEYSPKVTALPAACLSAIESQGQLEEAVPRSGPEGRLAMARVSPLWATVPALAALLAVLSAVALIGVAVVRGR